MTVGAKLNTQSNFQIDESATGNTGLQGFSSLIGQSSIISARCKRETKKNNFEEHQGSS